jgi:hypothetical protein
MNFEDAAFTFNNTINESFYGIYSGRYGDHMERWLKYFDLSQFHFADGEKLITEPVSEVNNLRNCFSIYANFSFVP